MMHITAFNKGISHPDVLVISQRLDEAINGLYKVDLIERDCISEQQPVVNNTEPRNLHTVLRDKAIYSKLNLRRIRRSLMPTKEFIKLTGISKSRIYNIESGTSYIYRNEIKLIAEILNTTPEVISEGLLVWDKDKPIPFCKDKKNIKVNR